MPMMIPTMKEIEARRIRADIKVMELARKAKVAAWTYHRIRRGDWEPGLVVLRRLDAALRQFESEAA